MSAGASKKPDLPSPEARRKINVSAEDKIASANEDDSGSQKGSPAAQNKIGEGITKKTKIVNAAASSSPVNHNGEDPHSTPAKVSKTAGLQAEDHVTGNAPEDTVKPSLQPFGSVTPVTKEEGEGEDSTASNQDTNGDRTAQEHRETADSAGAYFTAKGADTLDEIGLDLDPEDAKRLEDDFEEVTVDELYDGSAKGSQEASNTAASAPTTQQDPGVKKAAYSESQGIQDGQRSQSIAKDLADAEEEAESQARKGKPPSKQPPALDLPGDAAFEEEQLKSAEKSAVPPRPFSPPPATVPDPIPQANIQAVSEPDEFKGLVYYDGVDTVGRPVVIINADALPRSVSRKAAVHYLLQRLEPIVTQGPYVCVFLSTGENSKGNRLPAGWLASCYREMSYPFKKNVKHVILVRPSFSLRVMLALMYPLISKKAAVKIKKIEKLSALETATAGEVTLQHLGPRFNTIAAKSIIAAEGPGFVQDSAYQMPTL